MNHRRHHATASTLVASRIGLPVCAMRGCEQPANRAYKTNHQHKSPDRIQPHAVRRGRAQFSRCIREELLLVKDAIDLSRGPTGNFHFFTSVAHAATGRPSGESSDSQSHAREWASPWRRVFDQRPASLRDVPMSGGRNFIGWSLHSLPTDCRGPGQSSPALPSEAAAEHAHAVPPCDTSPRSTRVSGRTHSSPSAAKFDWQARVADRS